MVSASFKLVFISILGLTAAAGLTAVAIAFFADDPLTESQKDVMNTFSAVFLAGTGELFGLFWGKVVE